MKKYLVKIEFRYSDKPENKDSSTCNSKHITIGVFDKIEEAFDAGNKAMELLESKFDLHKFPDGTLARKERFSKNGGAFGSMKNLITNGAYLKTPFQFYAKITTLKYDDLSSAVNEVSESQMRYNKWRRHQDD